MGENIKLGTAEKGNGTRMFGRKDTSHLQARECVGSGSVWGGASGCELAPGPELADWGAPARRVVGEGCGVEGRCALCLVMSLQVRER